VDNCVGMDECQFRYILGRC